VYARQEIGWGWMEYNPSRHGTPAICVACPPLTRECWKAGLHYTMAERGGRRSGLQLAPIQSPCRKTASHCCSIGCLFHRFVWPTTPPVVGGGWAQSCRSCWSAPATAELNVTAAVNAFPCNGCPATRRILHAGRQNRHPKKKILPTGCDLIQRGTRMWVRQLLYLKVVISWVPRRWIRCATYMYTWGASVAMIHRHPMTFLAASTE